MSIGLRRINDRHLQFQCYGADTSPNLHRYKKSGLNSAKGRGLGIHRQAHHLKVKAGCSRIIWVTWVLSFQDPEGLWEGQYKYDRATYLAGNGSRGYFILSGDVDDSADVFGFGEALLAICQTTENQFIVVGSKANLFCQAAIKKQ